MICSETEDWRQFVMDQWHGEFWYVRSWRFTFVNEFYRRREWEGGEISNPFRDSMSDMITLVSRASLDAAKLPKLQPDSVRRVPRISVQEFIENYSQIAEPVIITGAMQSWPAMRQWQKEQFVKKYGHLKFRTDQSYTKTGTSVKMRLENYFQYVNECREDEDPIYIFDPKFTSRTKEYLQLAAEYKVEDYFTEDLLSVLGEEKRPRYKWIVCGCKNSGTVFHIDPYQTSAWNALIYGRKRWAFYGRDQLPRHLRKGKPRRSSPSQSSSNPMMDSDNLSTNSCTRDSYKPLYKCRSYEPLEWYSESYPQSFVYGEGPRECIQEAGEIIFVPGGIWHNVLNLEDSMAVTQNMANTQNFRQVFYEIWDFDKRLGRKFREKLLEKGRSDLFANLGIDFSSSVKNKRKRRKVTEKKDGSEDADK